MHVPRSNPEQELANSSFTDSSFAARNVVVVSNQLTVRQHHLLLASPFGKLERHGHSLHSRCGPLFNQHVSTLSCFAPRLRPKPKLSVPHPTISNTIAAYINYGVLVRSHRHSTDDSDVVSSQRFEMNELFTIGLKPIAEKIIAAVHSPYHMDF